MSWNVIAVNSLYREEGLMIRTAAGKSHRVALLLEGWRVGTAKRPVKKNLTRQQLADWLNQNQAVVKGGAMDYVPGQALEEAGL